LLSDQDKQELALLIEEKHIEPGTIIVHEGDVVDAVYLIFSGTANVTRTITKIGTAEIIPIITLSAGDAIGLNQEGLFSHLGFRIGTVTAASTMIVGMIDIRKFNAFLRKPGVPYPGLKNNSEKVLLMNFLENTHLFGHLPATLFGKITKNIDKLTLPQDAILFQQGDIADKCYFVISGQLAITTTDKNNKEHIIKIIDSSHIVGEGAFLNNQKRNATVRAVKDSELFVLDKSSLKIFEDDSSFIKLLNKTRAEQLRPLAKSDVSVSEQLTAEQEKSILLTNSSHNQSLQLSQQDYRIWQRLDGRTALHTILEEHEELKTLSIFDLYERILKMKKANLVEMEFLTPTTSRDSVWKKILNLKKGGNKLDQ
jgi:CRP-like cAMP-binding protein